MQRSPSVSVLDIRATDIARFSFKGRRFYFKTVWREKEFRVEVTDGRQLWKGKVDQLLLTEALCPKNMPMDEYLHMVRKTLQNNHEGGSISISQAQDPNQAKLTWRILVNDSSLQSNQKVSLRGVVLLDKVIEDRTARFQNFIDKLITQVYHYRDESQSLRTKVNQLEKQKKESLEKFEVLVKDKQGLELDLYSRFSLVLNTKKQKIRELTQQLNKRKQEPEMVRKKNVGTEKKKKAPTIVADPGSDSESTDSDEMIAMNDFNDSSEEEVPLPSSQEFSAPKKRRLPTPVLLSPIPSKSKKQSRLSTVDSRDNTSIRLFDDFDSPARVKVRRRRHKPSPQRIAEVNLLIDTKYNRKKDKEREKTTAVSLLQKRNLERKSPPPAKRKKIKSAVYAIDDSVSDLLNHAQ